MAASAGSRCTSIWAICSARAARRGAAAAASVICSAICSRGAADRAASAAPTRPRLSAPALATPLALAFANAYAGLKLASDVHQSYYALWERGPEIDRALDRVCPGCGVLEFDDGIVAHSLQRRVMSGTGLALDVEGDAARRRGELLALALARGYPLLATVYYVPPDDDAWASEDATRSALAGLSFLARERLD